MFSFLKRIVIDLVVNYQPPKNHFQRWTPEASQYLMNMDIEWKLIWLEHCLTLDCSRHYEKTEWRNSNN